MGKVEKNNSADIYFMEHENMKMIPENMHLLNKYMALGMSQRVENLLSIVKL